MKLNTTTKKIIIYRDGRCGMRGPSYGWVNKQPRSFAIECTPSQASIDFPELRILDPACGVIVKTDEGPIFRGAEMWTWGLRNCVSYQDREIRKKLHTLKLPTSQEDKLCQI